MIKSVSSMDMTLWTVLVTLSKTSLSVHCTLYIASTEYEETINYRHEAKRKQLT